MPRPHKRRTNAPLGGAQRHVLLVLSTRGESAAADWAAWHPLDYSTVYGAMQRLGMRGLVDVAGFNGRARTYKLTDAGFEAVNKIAPSEEVQDEESSAADHDWERTRVDEIRDGKPTGRQRMTYVCHKCGRHSRFPEFIQEACPGPGESSNGA